MNTADKEKIQALLNDFCETFPSQAKAVSMLTGVSEGTVINIRRKQNWNSISDEMWRIVGKQVGWHSSPKLEMVETMNFTTAMTYLADARDYGNMYIIVASCGAGKTYTAEWLKGKAKNIVHLKCQKHWNRKWFLKKMLMQMGKGYEGMDVTTLMDTIIYELMRMEKPLIILDEAHKLNDENLLFIIELENELNGQCGIVLMGNNALEQRINKGRDRGRIGFEDIYSRAGRRYISLPGITKQEAKQISKVNGIGAEADTAEIANEFNGDARRIQRAIHKINRKNKAA